MWMRCKSAHNVEDMTAHSNAEPRQLRIINFQWQCRIKYVARAELELRQVYHINGMGEKEVEGEGERK